MADEETKTFTPNKDGTISIKGEEGKEVRYALESDLMAVKGSAETAEKAHKEAQTAHETEVSKANENFAASDQKRLQAEAKVESLEEQLKQGGTTSKEELDKVKGELETASKNGEELTKKTLGYRRQLMVATYNIPADSIAEKTLDELDNYEEALKAVLATKGTGNLAIGGGGGGGPTPEAPLDRAKKILADAEAAGHVYGGGGSSFKKPE